MSEDQKNGPFYRLSLDIGGTTGWALSADNRIVNSGVATFRNKPGDHPGDRLATFFQWLCTNWNGVHEIHYEEVIGFSGYTDTSFFNRMYGILAMWSSTLRLPMIGINPTTLKHQFTGNGRAKKDEICELAMDLGWPHGERGTERFHDEADAVAILVVALAKRNQTAEFDYGRKS